jgi:hypothetical protein
VVKRGEWRGTRRRELRDELKINMSCDLIIASEGGLEWFPENSGSHSSPSSSRNPPSNLPPTAGLQNLDIWTPTSFVDEYKGPETPTWARDTSHLEPGNLFFSYSCFFYTNIAVYSVTPPSSYPMMITASQDISNTSRTKVVFFFLKKTFHDAFLLTDFVYGRHTTILTPGGVETHQPW